MKQIKKLRWWWLVLPVVLVLLVLSEVGLRLAGVTDFPVYDTDETIGYIPAPGQQGSFLNRNGWQVNERSMGSDAWQPNGQRDVLLLGDSILYDAQPAIVANLTSTGVVRTTDHTTPGFNFGHGLGFNANDDFQCSFHRFAEAPGAK